MQILIDISKEDYQALKQGHVPFNMLDVIKNGTPLPKGHGRLIDADALPLNAIDDANHGSNYIKIAHTIIEADKGESEDAE